MIICLALWNVLLVSCDDGDGDDEGGIFINQRSEQIIDPQSVEWLDNNKVRLTWVADVQAQSYLIYDKTDVGPMIRASIDAVGNNSLFELVIQNVDPTTSHDFKILAE